MLFWLKSKLKLIHRSFILVAGIWHTLTLTMDGDESPVLLQERGCIVDQDSKPKQSQRITISTNDAFAVKLHKARGEYTRCA